MPWNIIGFYSTGVAVIITVYLMSRRYWVNQKKANLKALSSSDIKVFKGLKAWVKFHDPTPPNVKSSGGFSSWTIKYNLVNNYDLHIGDCAIVIIADYKDPIYPMIFPMSRLLLCNEGYTQEIARPHASILGIGLSNQRLEIKFRDPVYT